LSVLIPNKHYIYYSIHLDMNQKIIAIIIGLLTVAVIGVMSLQIKFILDTRREKEEQFNNHIRAAIKNVAERIEKVGNVQLWNGFSIQQFNTTPNGFSYSETTVTSTDPSVLQRQKLAEAQFLQEVGNKPIEELIDLEKLDNFLKAELSERGINIPYDYGVFSNHENGFFIFNNSFRIPQASQPNLAVLKMSEYRTNLFNNGVKSRGLLMLSFPTKSSFIWSGLWSILLLSLLFAAIIIACFGYTISVIFRQKKLSEMKTDFINNMTHEFKTPIATISLAADSIAHQNIINNPEKIKKFVEMIKQENKRMHGQVEKVLQMAQIERNTLKLNISNIDLHEVIDQAVRNISLQVEKKDGTVAMNLNAERPIIEGDSNHISNVINNLLDNANKYSPEKPDITVSTRNTSSGVEITISDKGIGMSKEAKKRIFEKFYRVHTGNVHDVKGFGLGLAYVKTMVTAHQGSIDVKSELDKGSSFIVFLPFYSQGIKEMA
jgi:two-component system, OmpR family, phosphate regulon sensor histidine kinase PhoR